MSRALNWSAVLAVSVLLLAMANASAAEPFEFSRDTRPFLDKYCARCHRTGAVAAGLNLDIFKSPVSVQQYRERAGEVIHALETGIMPLKGQLQPSDSERAGAIAWFRNELNHFDFEKYKDPGNLPLHRLNRTQYRNTIRDLVGLGEEIYEQLPADESTYGFDHLAEAQDISPAHMERYLDAARYILDRVFLPTAKTWQYEARKLPFVRQFGLSSGDERVKLPDETPANEVNDAEHVFIRAGGVVVAHTFPHTGLYKLRVAGWGSEAEGVKNGPSLKVKLDADKVGELRPGIDGPAKPREMDARFVVRAGRHDVKIEMEGTGYAPNAAAPALQFNRVGLGRIEITGPLPDDEARYAQVRSKLLVAAPGPGITPRRAARQVLDRFVPLAFRRPAQPAEIEKLLTIFDRSLARGRSYETSVKLTLTAVLASPNFLFHVTDERNVREPYAVNDFDLASRLSYFLWASMPDEELFRLAGQNRLHEPAVLYAQTTRMLKDARSKSLAEKFAPQWLGLGSLFAVHRDEPFHENNVDMRQMLLDEVVLFFDSVVREDRNVFDLLDANYTFVNERLARHYGIPGIVGKEMRRVELAGPVRDQRGGVITMAGVLLSMSHPAETNLSGRGRWLLDAVLGTPPPPHPASVKPLPVPKKGEVVDSLRDRLALHRSDPSCAGCHAKIDPLGFALENYDQVGAWRTKDRDKPVNAAGQLPGGETFEGPVQLKTLLASKHDLFVRNLARRMFTYGLRRRLEFYDEKPLRDAEAALAAGNYRISLLIHSIVQSYPFQYRNPIGEGGK